MYTASMDDDGPVAAQQGAGRPGSAGGTVGGVPQAVRLQLLHALRAAMRTYLEDHADDLVITADVRQWRHAEGAQVLTCLLQIFLHGVQDLGRTRKRAASASMQPRHDLWSFFTSLGPDGAAKGTPLAHRPAPPGLASCLARVAAEMPGHEPFGRCREFVRACITHPGYLEYAFVSRQAPCSCPPPSPF